MDKEFLKDYERELLDEQTKFIENSIAGKFSSCREYLLKRLNNPEPPFSQLHESLVPFKVPIWTYVPTSKTLLVHIAPIKNKDGFERMHGFKIDDIPEMVEYVKNQGKIQFILAAPPSYYKEMDYLEPIFYNLKPPNNLLYSPKVYFPEKEVEKYAVQFAELSKFKLFSDLIQWSNRLTGNKYAAYQVFDDMSVTYCFIRGLGYNLLVDQIEDAIISKTSDDVISLFSIARLLARPLTKPLKSMITGNVDFITKQNQLMTENFLPSGLGLKQSFPGDIGKFLLKRTVHATPSLESCKQLTYIYEEEDVYTVGQALNQAIDSKKPGIIKEKSKEMEIILDNIWKDKTITKRILGAKIGIKLILAAVGTVSKGLEGLGIGLLAGLGFDVANEFFKFEDDETISEKIGKSFSSNYEILIYDFKKKYPRTAT